ncbi:hypothetical protein JJC00_01990 [Bradyrhizobium diazoefficiens]|uniref:hypothetical protein n=1 Tax=Bradyrhizobium diazoefficiens TaxID=1355477 RepID=UPI00190DC6A8|nr:hypothetical protein [Bradyrhizobium diazoefficiens]QQO34500.1 hypothetical protein JJC00_01990 [Bradyrhizobium diazoefficiens]
MSSMLTDDRIKEIASEAARENHIGFTNVTTAPAIDSKGGEAIEITIELTAGSSAAIMGKPSALTVSEVIRRLADAGEGRFPIVRYIEARP